MARLRHVYDPAYNFGRGIPFVKVVHGFVLNKPAQIRHRLIELGVKASDFERPPKVRSSDLLAIHSSNVIAGLRSSRSIAAAGEFAPLAFAPNVVARHMLVTPQLRACGGTALGLAHAAHGDWVFNLSGGFHHAGPNTSHGFCLVSDVAWAVHALRKSGLSKRILVLDLDLHQGDGNANFFASDTDVFTASLHQESAFPVPKARSDLDVGLTGHVGDEEYLGAVDSVLDTVLGRFSADIVIYVAGTDPFKDDAIGSFSVTAEGLRARDERVAHFVKEHGMGLVALPAGGYSEHSPRLSANGFSAMAAVLAEN